MYGNGWPGPDRERRQHRDRSGARRRASSSRELLVGRVLDGADDDPLGGERGARARRARAVDCAAVSSSTRSRTSASACCGVRPSGERTLTRAITWSSRPGDAHHEELVEVRREDRAELHALEQRLARVGGEVEDAVVQVEPRELAVEERRGASCLGRGSVIVAMGRPSSRNAGERWVVDLVYRRQPDPVPVRYAPRDAERPAARRPRRGRRRRPDRDRGRLLREPAKSLPGFFPGHQAGSSHHHVKHGIAAFLLGLACLVFAWFQTGPEAPAAPA